MNKQKILAPNQGLVPKMMKPKMSVADFIKKRATRQALIQYRYDAIAAQNRQNYINEHDRISGLLHQSVTNQHIDFKRLKNRQEELKHLYEQSLK